MANITYNIITSDDIKKAEEYKKALDELHKSLNGINSKLPSFADGIKAGLQAVGEKLPEVVDAIQKLNDQNKELAASGLKPKNILKELAGSFFSLNSLISVGITLLVTYGEVVVDWVSNLIKGETTLSAFGKQLKDNKIVMEALNKARVDGDNNAQQELVHLKLLYDATQNQNLSLNDRKKVVNELRSQYPHYFKNLGDETILTGKAISQYKELAGAITASARARAAEEIMVTNSKRQLGNSIKAAPLVSNLKKLEADIKTAQNVYDNTEDDVMISGAPVYTAGTSTSGKQKAKNNLNYLTQEREKLLKEYNAIATDSKILNRQNIFLTKRIVEDGKKFGGEIITGSKSSETSINDSKTIVDRPIVNDYKHSASHSEKNHQSEISRSAEKLEAHALTFNKQLEQDKLHYNTEMTLLADQLQKKLISQEEFNKQSKQLQDTYHQNIGNNVEIFRKDKLDEMQKITQQIVDQNTELAAGKKKEEIKEDEKKAKDAILPRDIFNAEKKLIEDKYAYEIIQAKGNEEKIKTIKEKSQEDLNALTERYEQQRKEFALNAAQQVADKAFSIIGNNIKSSSDAKIKGLERDKEKELSNKSLTATQRKAIEDKYQKKENQEKVKAFKAEQKASVLQAVVNGALAITKATSQTGILAPFVIPGIIASTALQVATIVAQKPPAYAKGGHFVSDGRGAVLPGYSLTDNTNAYLRSGEAVVVSEAMRNPWARNLVSAINVAHGGRDFSVPNTGRGYAIGGIFTDGGNANRYYNQPVTDIKDMANTLAYQMINNFPPIYVDVKDVNNQQNILAQTVNRVNL